MSLLRGLFWFCLFVFFAFCFVVLFEHGPSDFQRGFMIEWEKARNYAADFAGPVKKDKK